MEWMLRYGVPLLVMVSMYSRIAHARTQTDTICQAVEQGIRLHVDGMYGGYPHSVLHDAVLEGVLPCGGDYDRPGKPFRIA